MGRKCCVFGCRSLYDSDSKISMFRLLKEETERNRWIKAIPRDNLPNTSNTVVVCEKHWPEDSEKNLMHGKYGSASPPSIFNCVSKSLAQ